MYTVTAAQLSQTAFVAGSAGTSDDLFVKVYDGHVYTDWSEFHVNVAAPVGPASPAATALDRTDTASVVTRDNTKLESGIHLDAATDPLALFGMHAADHFVF
jgi:hypothetical protein